MDFALQKGRGTVPSFTLYMRKVIKIMVNGGQDIGFELAEHR